MTRDNDRTMPACGNNRIEDGPWGFEDGIGLFDAAYHSDADALREFIGYFDDWREYALSVEGPLMYHDVPGDPEGVIRPCECENDHEGQHEVWKVVAQRQEPTAKFHERRRIVKWLRTPTYFTGTADPVLKAMADEAEPIVQRTTEMLADRIEAGEYVA